MAAHSVKATLQIRRDTSNEWNRINPVLAAGEYGLETNTRWLKIGDGVTDWQHLPYLNKIDSDYFKQENDGEITFSDGFLNTIHTLEAAAGQAITQLIVTEPPVNDTDVPNKKYVDDMIAQAGHLHREVVETLPNAEDADPDVLYMMLSTDQTHYEEYMIINGVWDMVGSTGDGTGGQFVLEVATNARLGGVKASTADDEVNVTSQGFMTLNRVSTSKLYVPTGDVFVINGGNAS